MTASRRHITCPFAPRCVPCPLRGVPYGEQLRRKRARVESELARFPRLRHVAVDDTVGSRDVFGYRTVAKLAVRERRGRLVAGVYEPASHRLAESVGCEVQHPVLNEVLATTLDEATRLEVPAFDEATGGGELRYLVARYSHFTRRVFLVLVTRSRSAAVRELAKRVARRSDLVGGIAENLNPERGNVILGPRWATLRPPEAILERIGPLRLQASPGAFLQANPWTARRIYEHVVEVSDARSSDVAIDLFCGVGPLSLYLAGRARLVFGVEEVEAAIRDARSNARRNGFHNARFRAGVVEEVLPALGAELGRVDLITLNPPRKGAAASVLREVAALRPSRVVYVSCDPGTLARDLDRLAGEGYATKRVRPFDMMPQTEHVEAVAVLEATGPAPERSRRS